MDRIGPSDQHRNVTIGCDEDAVQELKVKTVKYFKEMEIIEKATRGK